jgi:hypothetical protein
MKSGPLVKSPGDDQSLASTLRFIQRAIEMDMENCLPCRVMAYDREANRATVRPAIMSTVRSTVSTDLIRKNRVEYPDIPVLSLGAGGFHISFPVKKGDLGWIYACDRDISLFLQSLTEQPAGLDGPSHKFSDAIFIPDVFSKYNINEEDEGALVIQSTSSATRISIREDNIKITAPVKVQLDTPLTEILHDLTVSGNLSVAGPTAILPQATTVGGATVYGHTHGGAVPPFS